MKKYTAILLMIFLMLNLTGCATLAEDPKPEVIAKAVKVQKVEDSNQSVTMDYIGTVDAKDIVKYSFKVPGQIRRIFVKKGDKITKGTLLAELDTTDLGYQADGAKAIMETAKLNIRKAESAKNYTNSLYEKVNALYAKGSVSKDQYEQVSLQKEVSATEYNQAKSQYEAAKVDYEYKASLLVNSVIVAEDDGYVIDKVFNENERVGPYMPVVVIRSGVQVINVGIPQQELSKMKVGSTATIIVDGAKAKGTVTNIAEAPDTTTRTYNAEISVSDKKFRLGSIAKVSIGAGTQKGIWIPMALVLSDGENYVYVIKDNRAFKRIIEIRKINNDKVLVDGLENGEFLAVSGMKNLVDGSQIKIVE